ncbi:hypothetical protein [Lysobacter sp. Hz 25]|uniref:hypothetical protein n=1 Tax=Lysobacter sp. Hz 25 TaxID=3383698 RepID=UPI0038D42C72
MSNEPTTLYAIIYEIDGAKLFGELCKTPECAVNSINPLDGSTVLGMATLDRVPGSALMYWKRQKAATAPAEQIADAGPAVAWRVRVLHKPWNKPSQWSRWQAIGAAEYAEAKSTGKYHEYDTIELQELGVLSAAPAPTVVVDEAPALWCLHLQGPDEVHAAPSKAHAEKAAEQINAVDDTGLVRAVAAPWPHSVESHAEDSDSFIERWLIPSGHVAAADLDPFRPQWPTGLKQGEHYMLLCDDKGRNGGTWVKVYVGGDGDVHLTMQDWEERPEGEPFPIPSLRCRTLNGGGRNSRSHQALLWLAQAIRLDAAEQNREG